jgi:dienelactone hydrolase
MRKTIGLCGAVLALGLAGIARADDAAGSALAAKFGAREAVQSMSISPDGLHIAIIVPAPAGQNVMIADLVRGGAPAAALVSDRKTGTITNCGWLSTTRLICNLRMTTDMPGVLAVYTRIVAIDLDGRNYAVLTARATSSDLGVVWNGGSLIDWTGERPGEVLMTRSFVPQETVGTHLARSDNGLGVESVDAVNLKRRVVEKAKPKAVRYISDGEGHVRIMGLTHTISDDYDSGVIDYFYRKRGSSEWNELGRLDSSSGSMSVGFEPYAVDPVLDVVYGFEAQPNGLSALVQIKLDGSRMREVAVSRDDVDVDSLVTIGRQHRVVGASFATERRQVDFFDPELRKLGAALQRALPGNPSISFVDASSDEKRLLLFAGSDVDPGMFYLYDKATHQLEQVLASRPDLAGLTLSPMKPVRYRAADGAEIPAYLTLPATGTGKDLPAIVMPHGGPAARDEWGFDWLVQYFASRGYAVLQPNYRGSAGYGSDWYQKNGFQSWRTAIGDIDDAGRWLVSQGIAAPGKLAVFGWSYGGYAALQSGATEPGLFKAIVAVAPVTDLDRLRADANGYTNGVLVDRFIGHGEHVESGSPARHAASISAPVMLFHGDVDANVGVSHSRLMAERLRGAGKSVDYTEFAGLDHYLEDSQARATMLAKSDAFIRKALGLAP